MKFDIDKLIDIEYIHRMFIMFRKLTGITTAFARQKTLQEEDDYSNSFCKNCIKGSEKGKNKCMNHFSNYVLCAETTDKDYVEHKCHVDLIDLVIPIRIHNKTVQFVVAGQFIDHPHDFEKAKEYAKELGIDEDFYIEEYKKVKYLNPSEKKLAIDYIVNFTKIISTFATEVYEEKIKNVRDKIFILSDEIIKEKLSFDDALQVICDCLCHCLKYQRAVVLKINKKNNKISLIKNQIEPNNPLYNLIKEWPFDISSIIAKYWKEKLSLFDLPERTTKIIDFNDPEMPTEIKNRYKETNIKNGIGTMVQNTGDEALILLILNYFDDVKYNEFDVDLLKDIGRKISILFDRIKK